MSGSDICISNVVKVSSVRHLPELEEYFCEQKFMGSRECFWITTAVSWAQNNSSLYIFLSMCVYFSLFIVDKSEH